MGAGRYDSFDSGAVLHEKQAMRHPPSHSDAMLAPLDIPWTICEASVDFR
jgi:hypothetical protein